MLNKFINFKTCLTDGGVITVLCSLLLFEMVTGSNSMAAQKSSSRAIGNAVPGKNSSSGGPSKEERLVSAEKQQIQVLFEKYIEAYEKKDFLEIERVTTEKFRKKFGLTKEWHRPTPIDSPSKIQQLEVIDRLGKRFVRFSIQKGSRIESLPNLSWYLIETQGERFLISDYVSDIDLEL